MKKTMLCWLLSLALSSQALAGDLPTHEGFCSEIFISNNTESLDLASALQRLSGEEEENLYAESIKILQKNHVIQSTIEPILGTYTMASGQLTADNSEKIIHSYYDKVEAKTVFKLASQMATYFKQESVAVFIPGKESVGDTILHVESHPYTVEEIVKAIHERLPASYSQAFSLHLKKEICSNMNNPLVDTVEWLGTVVKPEELGKAFPQEKILFYSGKAYLVYANGDLTPI